MVSFCCFGIMIWGQQNSEVDGYVQMDYVFECGVDFWDMVEMYLVLLLVEM